MRERLTETEARYLLTMYEVYAECGCITPKQIAERMNVKRPTAYEYILKFVEKGLLCKISKKYALTEMGIKKARKILRKHRILESMFYETGVSLDKACECAHRIQTSVDDDIVEHIARYLGSPKKCPHGEPIPEVER